MRSETSIANAAHPATALKRAGVRPRKSRGQNFLVQETIAQRIVDSARIEPGDHVIEIGPGLGRLTEILRQSPARLTLVELDADLAAALERRFQRDPCVKVIAEDFLKIDLACTVEYPVKVIGNLPFNVASAILQKLCSSRTTISRMVLMFQREVADRIRAAPGRREYGAISVFTALYWHIVEHFRVAAGSFHPRPKVDAAVLVFMPNERPDFAPDEEPRVLELIRAAFSAPRKTIRNSLAGGLGIAAADANDALVTAAIDPGARPGMLTSKDFIRIARVIGKAKRTQGALGA